MQIKLMNLRVFAVFVESGKRANSLSLKNSLFSHFFRDFLNRI